MHVSSRSLRFAASFRAVLSSLTFQLENLNPLSGWTHENFCNFPFFWVLEQKYNFPRLLLAPSRRAAQARPGPDPKKKV